MSHGAFQKVMSHELGRYYKDMLDSWERWDLMWMKPHERAAYQAQKRYWSEHKGEAAACRGIELFAKAQYAEFLIRAALWTTRHTSEHIRWRVVMLMRGAESQDEQHGQPEIVITTASMQQLKALAWHAWPGRWDYKGDSFSDWLIKLRIADPAPSRAMLWVYY